MAIGRKSKAKDVVRPSKPTHSGIRITQVNNYPLQQTRVEADQPFRLVFEDGGLRIELEDDYLPTVEHEGHWSLTDRLNALELGQSITVTERLWPGGSLTTDKDIILGRGGGKFEVELIDRGYRFTRVKEGNV